MRINARLGGGSGGSAALRPLLEAALAALDKGTVERGGPLPVGGADAVTHRAVPAEPGLPETGIGAERALQERAEAFAATAVEPADPSCAAHLHAPPLAVAVAADLVASTLNSSLDSWDQGPSGTVVETQVVRALTELVGFSPEVASGAFTSGGTESNLTALMLARDNMTPETGNVAETLASRQVPARVFCSTQAHFSVSRAAGVLGLGEEAVTAVPVDSRQLMDVDMLRDLMNQSVEAGERPLAVVATAGTTDLGVVDPLTRITEVAREFDAWVHVDAAYGAGALFSARLAPLLSGIEWADSVALDLHKFGWQPAAAGVLLTKSAELFEPLERRVAYLNTDDDEQAGYQGLLNRSLRTTRRADAFKVDVTLRALGRGGMGMLVERCHDLARHAATKVTEHPRLRLLHDPVLSTIVFRYVPERGDADQVNAALRRYLLDSGRAVVGRTELDGAVQLKLTLLNPHASEADLDALLQAVVTAGDKETPGE